MLDRKLLEKIRLKKGKKKITDINVLVSRKAHALGIPSPAALILLAREVGVGTANYLKKLSPSLQTQVQSALSNAGPKEKINSNNRKPSRNAESKTKGIGPVIDYLLIDAALIKRTRDILLAKANFDRPINQATLILEERIRTKAKPTARLVGVDLVNYAFNGDPTKTVLKISDDPGEQRGFTDILRGIVLSLRNKTHHHLIDSFTREEALKICAFIDVLLKVVDTSQKVK